MSAASYSCVALAGTNKGGILKPDGNGYYEQVLGAFDFHNASGDYYPFQSAKQLFEASSSFMRRIKNGQCHGELGHPQKQPGMSMRDFIARILRIDEKNVCVHFADVRIDKDSVKDENGKPVIAVIGRVKPAGPYGSSLEESLKNPEENVAFSVRSLTRDIIQGAKRVKNMSNLITYDRVLEPGISVATKYNSPSLEALESQSDIITPEMLDILERDASTSLALESGGMSVAMVRSDLGWTAVERITPASLCW